MNNVWEGASGSEDISLITSHKPDSNTYNLDRFYFLSNLSIRHTCFENRSEDPVYYPSPVDITSSIFIKGCSVLSWYLSYASPSGIGGLRHMICDRKQILIKPSKVRLDIHTTTDVSPFTVADLPLTYKANTHYRVGYGGIFLCCLIEASPVFFLRLLQQSIDVIYTSVLRY